MFPIWSRKHNDKKTKFLFHVVEVTAAVFLSILSPVIFISVSEYKVLRSPPVLCLPSKDVYFFTTCVPLCIIVGTGSVIAIIIFWTLHKVSITSREHDKEVLLIMYIMWLDLRKISPTKSIHISQPKYLKELPISFTLITFPKLDVKVMYRH